MSVTVLPMIAKGDLVVCTLCRSTGYVFALQKAAEQVTLPYVFRCQCSWGAGRRGTAIPVWAGKWAKDYEIIQTKLEAPKPKAEPPKAEPAPAPVAAPVAAEVVVTPALKALEDDLPW